MTNLDGINRDVEGASNDTKNQGIMRKDEHQPLVADSDCEVKSILQGSDQIATEHTTDDDGRGANIVSQTETGESGAMLQGQEQEGRQEQANSRSSMRGMMDHQESQERRARNSTRAGSNNRLNRGGENSILRRLVCPRYSLTTRTKTNKLTHFICMSAILCSGFSFCAFSVNQFMRSRRTAAPITTNDPDPKDISNCSTAISCLIERKVSFAMGEDPFQDRNSPQYKARHWLVHHDEFNLTTTSDNLFQRYVLAAFYMATTLEKPWLSCNKPAPGDESTCLFTKLISLFPEVEYEYINAMRWLSDSHECEWIGIFCDEFDVVRAIELPGLEISAKFPSEITLLPYLQSITLTYNNFYGTLPEQLMDMRHLLNVEFHYNEFTGTIADVWWTNQALQRLNIAGNYLTGNVPTAIGASISLKGMFIFENSLTGTIPTEIGTMKFLSFTRWGRNFMTGTMPSEVGNLRQLKEMWFHRNVFTGPLPSEMANMENLQDLRLHFNRFSGSIPSEHYSLSWLQRWDLYDCNLTSTISPLIGNMRLLQVYRIRENNFYGTVPTELAQVTDLAELWLHQNDLTGTIPGELCALRSPEDRVGITVLDADCGPTEAGGGPPLIDCPSGCCTACCDAKLGFCNRDHNG